MSARLRTVLIGMAVGAMTTAVRGQTDSTATEEVFFMVENMPRFPGGEKAMYRFLQDELRYPREARNKGIQGTVYLSFVVDSTGRVRDTKVLRGVHRLLDEEALRVISAMPHWEPGTQRGKAVHTQYNLPIRFSLGKQQKKKKGEASM